MIRSVFPAGFFLTPERPNVHVSKPKKFLLPSHMVCFGRSLAAIDKKWFRCQAPEKCPLCTPQATHVLRAKEYALILVARGRKKYRLIPLPSVQILDTSQTTMTAIRYTSQPTIETASAAQRSVPSSPQNNSPPELSKEIYPDDQPPRSPTPINDQDGGFESVEIENYHAYIEHAPGPWYQDACDVARSLKNMHFPKPDVMIAVMGKTGTGKTSFINAVTGKSMEVGHDLRACEFALVYILVSKNLTPISYGL